MKRVTGLDIGTTKIACLVGERDERGRTHLLGHAVVPSHGIKKGVIVDVQEAVNCIQQAVTEAEQSAGHEIEDVLVGVAGSHIRAMNSRGTTTVIDHGQRIAPRDVRGALEAARAIAIPHSQEVIHVVPRGYWIDGSNGVRDPIGLHGYRLDVEAHIVTAASNALKTYERVCEEAGLSARAFVLEPLASGEAVLTEDEREMGVVLVDIGGGTTDVSIFLEGAVWHTASIPVGGNHLSHDLAVALQCPLPVAEEIKKRYGYAAADRRLEDGPIDLAGFGDSAQHAPTRREIAEVLSYRVADIFDLIQLEMKRSAYDGLLPAGLVFCGGSAQLTGLKEAGRDFFELPVRVAAPHGPSGMADMLRNPAYATSVGLLEWGFHHDDSSPNQPLARRNGARSGESWTQQLRQLLRSLLPN